MFFSFFRRLLPRSFIFSKIFGRFSKIPLIILKIIVPAPERTSVKEEIIESSAGPMSTPVERAIPRFEKLFFILFMDSPNVLAMVL